MGFAFGPILRQPSFFQNEEQEGGKESEDWASDAIEEEEKDDLLLEMNEMRTNAQKSAEWAAAKEAGVSADIGNCSIRKLCLSSKDSMNSSNK